ncbi:hypothetical protein SAMN04488029_2578 [Reichenbachiella faecimaris]|uniref:Uncharacterized protein n=1 Tax=Reichenbachiella faecimaris TaxID=692418 RepID=A0A1W2GGU5_REIFA|nr:hypothetical protein SAMN04488029_2578 [Reichenbachiella faecimaris]
MVRITGFCSSRKQKQVSFNIYKVNFNVLQLNVNVYFQAIC